MKNLKELFVACGGEVDNDFVTIPDELNPIDIVLKVVPTDFDLLNNVVTCRVLVADRLEGAPISDLGSVYTIRHTEYDIDISLPIEAVVEAINTKHAAEQIAKLTEECESWKKKYTLALPSADD